MDADLLEAMIGQVRYRGPDEIGVLTQEGAGLAHARLSIIDLAGGRQPMPNEDRTVWIVFNGEIFNYVELRRDLERKGHRFATRSDTEVIIHLYEEKGESCVELLNGQWAFAIFDNRRNRLFLSRDRLGIRPLFYTVTANEIVFGSEVKSIFARPGVERAWDPAGLSQIATFWVTIPPRTVFANINELPPGCSMVADDRRIATWSYWQPEYPETFEERPEDEWAEELRTLLEDATRIRLRSDVPVGAYLSGGLDSSVIAATVKRCTDAHLRTFSVTFDNAEYDEREHQLAVIRYLNTDHREQRCSNRDVGAVFPDVVWHAEKPLVRTAPGPLLLLSRLVRENGYKVVLTGEGADELFGGYDIFKEAKIRRFWARQPDSSARAALLKRLYPYMPNVQRQPAAYLRAFFHVQPGDVRDPFFSHLPRWNLTSRLKIFFGEDLRQKLRGSDPFDDLRAALPEAFYRADDFCRAQYLETRFLLPGYILSSQGDRMAMANSVEARFPFLDHRIVELAARIPPRLKMKGLAEKYILKKAAGDLVPASVKRRPKQPYRAPETSSFFDTRPAAGRAPTAAGGALLPYVEELFSRDGIERTGLFDGAAVGKLLEKVRAGRAIGIKDGMALAFILSAQLVQEQFIAKFKRWSHDGADSRLGAGVHSR